MKLVRFALAALAFVFAPLVVAADTRPALVVAVNELPRGLEPAENHGNVDIRVSHSLCVTLLRRDFSTDNGALKPLLAESWSRISPTVVEVKLRRGVTFHNGAPFDADDVLFTFSPERLIGKEAVIPGGRQYFGHLKDEQKIEQHARPASGALGRSHRAEMKRALYHCARGSAIPRWSQPRRKR